MERIELTNAQILNVQTVECNDDKLVISFVEALMDELEQVFTYKGLTSSIKVLTEDNSTRAIYSGYTNFISIEKDMSTQLIYLTLSKEDQTQVKIAELEQKVKELTNLVTSKL